MFPYSDSKQIHLICFVVNFGMSSKVIHEAKNCGIQGSTVFFGKGTAKNAILDYLGLADIRKEIILMLADCETAQKALITLNQHFKLEKPNHGIAFSILISEIAGTHRISCNKNIKEKGSDRVMYHLITSVVDKGKAEDVISAANKAGSTGGTIINGRGSGVHETTKLFMMDIEPEKEIVMILSEADKTKGIMASIVSQLKMDEPGNGVLYVQEVESAYGIFNETGN